MDNEIREIFGKESDNLVEDDAETFGRSYETQGLISVDSYVSERVQDDLKDSEGHRVRVEKEKKQRVKELKHETSPSDVKESISAEYPVDIKIHENIKSGKTKIHVTDEQTNPKLEAASQQRHGESLPGKDNDAKLWESSTELEHEVCSTTNERTEVVYDKMERGACSDKKSSSSGVHVDAERPKSLTGGRTEFHSLSNVPPNRELLTESKNMEASTSGNLNECDVDIQRMERSSVGGYDATSLRKILSLPFFKVRSMTGARPKVKYNVDLEKTSLLGAESVEYEDYLEEDFSGERNADVSLYENPKSGGMKDYDPTDFRFQVGETEHCVSFKVGHSSSSVETPEVRDLEESIELAHEASEAAREAAFTCFAIVKVVEDGIDIAQKYMEITSNRARKEGSGNYRYQSDGDEYRRILSIASDKMKVARGTAESAYIAAKNTYKRTTEFLNVQHTESTDVKDSRYLMNWARNTAKPAEIDAYKAAFSSLKAIKKFFRKMDNSRNMDPSRDRYFNDLAKIGKRNRCFSIVLILAFILGCVTVILYNIFKPDGNKAYYYIYYTGFALITCSAIVGFCRTLPGCTNENVVLEEQRQRTIRKIDQHLRLVDEYFKTHNITHVGFESEDDVYELALSRLSPDTETF